MQASFDYAVVRIVPRVDRQEFINAGILLHSIEHRFLAARVHFDRSRVEALWPGAEFEALEQHLAAFPRVCIGGPEAGPIGLLSQRERFHWLVSPRSTAIQTSPVHSGLCDSPAEELNRLLERLVLR